MTVRAFKAVRIMAIIAADRNTSGFGAQVLHAAAGHIERVSTVAEWWGKETKMTDTARLRALLAAATPGPWENRGCKIVPSWDKWMDLGSSAMAKDAALIVEAVNALPGLIAENERLRAALGRIATEQTPSGCTFSARIALEALNAKG